MMAEMFSELAREHIQNPRFGGKLENATHVGVAGSPGDGPYCVLYLEVADGIILRASFETNGCPTSMASAGVLCHLIIGRDLNKALLFESDDLRRVIGTVPEGKEDCPERAVIAFNAIAPLM